MVFGVPTQRVGQIARVHSSALQSPGQARLALLAGAGDRRHDFLRFKIDFAEHVVLGVGDVERVASERHALRMVERRGFVESPSAWPIAPTADDVEQLAVEDR